MMKKKIGRTFCIKCDHIITDEVVKLANKTESRNTTELTVICLKWDQQCVTSQTLRLPNNSSMLKQQQVIINGKKHVDQCKDHLWPNVKRTVIKTAHFTVSNVKFSVKKPNNGRNRIWGKNRFHKSGSTCTETSQLKSLLVHRFPSS